MTRISTVLIGQESLLVGCGDHLIAQGHDIRAVVSEDASIRAWAEGQGIAVIANAADLPAQAPAGTFDWLLSIANLSLLPAAVLALPAQGAVNFHDGPLPDYAGLNTPAWALLNGERRHGITWHLIAGGVDEGDILEQRMVDIAPGETAFTLNSKCYAAAMDSFPALLDQLATGQLDRTPQDLARRRYFARDDRPGLAGLLDFNRPAEVVAANVRALDFGGYRNPLLTAKLCLNGVWLAVGAAEAVATGSAGAPGTVMEVTGDSLAVATVEGIVTLSSLTGLDGRAIDPAQHAAPGDMLDPPDARTADALNDAAARAARAEPVWRRLLDGLQPATLPLATAGRAAPDWQCRAIPAARMPLESCAAAVLAWARMGMGDAEAAIAYRDAATSRACAAVPGLLSDWVPLTAADHRTIGNVTGRLENRIADSATCGPFAADLPLREPGIGPLHRPDIALTGPGLGPVEGTVVTVEPAGDGGVLLHHDARRLSADAVDLLAARLGQTLAAAGAAAESASFATLARLPEDERQRLVSDWNDTARDTGKMPRTVHQAFEAQVNATPDAPALVFEAETLSYADLNARANALARLLQDHGVTPGAHVGLCVARGPQLLVGALAILKAGGAYVPLDPAYPAERLAHYLSDSGAGVIVTQSDLRGTLPETGARVLVLEDHPGIAAADPAAANIDAGVGPDDLAYVIYTSGSTGTPKGVMVEHGNVANFFAGMDDVVDHENGGVWLAVTSLAFDISVLELFYTLARGFKLVLCSDEGHAAVSGGPIGGSGRHADFSLYYWGNDCAAGTDKYALLLEGAKFADANGFDAVWTPERHFHAFGGQYPNPAVTGAAVAAVTRNLQVRAGSCVAPLHHPARIAEEWAVIDNLTNGGAGLAIASGWQPEDFVLRPENTPPENKPAMFETIDQLRRLWRGEPVEFPSQTGEMQAVLTQPRPVSKELALWVTTAGNPETWREAGATGANVLTHLLGQTIEEVGDKITIYHEALRRNGFDPADRTVTVMLHTLIGADRDHVRETARDPLKAYLRSAAGLIKQYAWAFPAFKKPEGVTNPFQLDLSALDGDEMEAILDFAFERYFNDAGLFGTVEDGIARVEQLKQFGVGEVACLIDYGIPDADVMEGLTYLAEVCDRSNRVAELREDDFSIAAQIIRHDVTHMQCTPSMARMLCMNDEARLALGRLRHLYLGGEALPGALVEDLRGCTRARITNMYGPTETTIWSATQPVEGPLKGQGAVAIGRPIANTALYVLNAQGAPVPVGVAGELHIGGAGVARGYWQRAELTGERFLPDHISGTGRMYRTGDLVRWRPDGRLDFIGRGDHQVKIRGQRIELGEIEACLASHPSVRECVVVARDDRPGETGLAAYLIAAGQVNDDVLRRHLQAHLPEVMVPRHIVQLERLPLTPNKKIDRSALPKPDEEAPRRPADPVPVPDHGSMADLARIWARILGIGDIRSGDSFFDLGGHSLLAVQAHREIRTGLEVPELAITDIFRFPRLSDLAAHVDALKGGASPSSDSPAPAVDMPDRDETMSRRKAMRAARGRRAG